MWLNTAGLASWNKERDIGVRSWELLHFQFCSIFFFIAQFWCETLMFLILEKIEGFFWVGSNVYNLQRRIVYIIWAWLRATLAYEVFDFVSKKQVKKFEFWMKIGFGPHCLRGDVSKNKFFLQLKRKGNKERTKTQISKKYILICQQLRVIYFSFSYLIFYIF